MTTCRDGSSWSCRDRRLDCSEQTLIMGILNVTPDSFSDGGCYVDVARAIDHAHRMISDGADIIDIGGESTRPGAQAVLVDIECQRVVPVIEALAKSTDCILSVDTMKAAVAEAALNAGAHIVNDVTALSGDPDMASVVSRYGAGVVLMHMLGTPRTMQQNPDYDHVVTSIRTYLAERINYGLDQGITPGQIVIDPGIGFGKTVEHNVALLANLHELASLGHPVLVGLSRKSFLGALTGCAVDDRLPASLAGLVCAIQAGSQILRVHDVKESCEAARVTDILRKATQKMP